MNQQPPPRPTTDPDAEIARIRLGEAHYTSLLLPLTCGDAAGLAAGAAAQPTPFETALRRLPSWALHAGRLRADARQMGLPEPSLGRMTVAMERAIGAARCLLDGDPQHPDALWRVRLDANASGPADLRALASSSVVSAQAASLTQRVRPAADVQIGPRLRNPRDPFAGAKRATVAMEFAVLRASQREGFDEVVLLDVDGNLSEAITSALWFGRDGIIYTPDLACAPLRSTTTALAMALASRQGWSLRTGFFGPDALLDADWAVLANAVAGARPVARVDGRALGPPPTWLVDATRDLVDGGRAATLAIDALRSGVGPGWACAAVLDGFQGAQGALP